MARNHCPQITETIAKTCKNTAVDLCEVRDELLFQRLVRYAERANSTYPALFEKYQSLLKGPPTKTTLKELAALNEEASPCVTATHQLWVLLLKQGTTKASRKSLVQNSIRKKLLNADLNSFTWDSLRMRVLVIDEAIAFQLVDLPQNQAENWKTIKQSLKESKALMEPISNDPIYLEKSQKATSSSGVDKAPQEELTRLNHLFSRVRSLHQQINNIFP